MWPAKVAAVVEHHVFDAGRPVRLDGVVASLTVAGQEGGPIRAVVEKRRRQCLGGQAETGVAGGAFVVAVGTVVVADGPQHRGVGKPAVHFPDEKGHRLLDESVEPGCARVPGQLGVLGPEAVGQGVAGENDQIHAGSGDGHAVQGRFEQRVVGVRSVGGITGQAGRGEQGLPLGNVGGRQRRNQRRVGEGVEMDVGKDKNRSRGRVRRHPNPPDVPRGRRRPGGTPFLSGFGMKTMRLGGFMPVTSQFCGKRPGEDIRWAGDGPSRRRERQIRGQNAPWAT